MAKSDLRGTVTLADVARMAGVSKGTASNVFNRPDIVREEVRERVMAAAKSSGYRGPDPKGRLLSAGKVNAIGVATVEPLSTFFTDPFARVMMTGITEVADANGIGISLVSAANQEELAWNMRNALVDGFILFCLEGAERLIALSHERQLPAVALSLDHAEEGLSAVGIDDVAGAQMIAAHLTGLGHRKFAVLSMELAEGSSGRVTPERLATGGYATSVDRINGYFNALRAVGIDTGDVPVFETQSDAETVRAALEEIFAAPSPPTAILAQSDRIALIALDWLKASGMAVPGDVSLAGFDGVPESALSDPPLTTIQQPIAEIGRRAIQGIVDRGTAVWREKLDVELVVRGSTAPPAA